MKIIKTEKQKNTALITEVKDGTELCEYTENENEKENENDTFLAKLKAFFTKNVKRNVAILSTLVLIVGAVYLNWILFAGEENYNPDNYVSGSENPSGGDSASGSENTGNGDSYFALALIDRSQARAEAIEVLTSITTSEDASDEAKESAYSEIAKIAEEIECESNIETLVKAKGFEECVTVISDGKASVIVSGEKLLVSEVAQIREIVYTQAGITPENITIIEKKA